MRLRFLGLVLPMLVLAACDTTPADTGATTGTGGTGTGTGASGITSTGPVARSGPLTADQMAEMLRQQGVGDRVFFQTDSSSLTPEGRNTIEGWARLLRQNPAISAAIEGHADERGTREYNLALGERRAVAARSHLVSLGIPAQRVTTVSYGKERPAVVGSNEAAWAQNRRAVLVPSQ
ncbi:MAG TPA: peptidoglycan-associated lipoprotein Pal [Alphaproteobacteria bacterium]|nr:peptidoglycan-associated lipoprotein Pal [Alphaproteobacteria bacterium]